MPVSYCTAQDIADLVDPEFTALLVIDMQNDYCSLKGGIAQRPGRDVSQAHRMAPLLGQFLTYCRQYQPALRIIHIHNQNSPWSFASARKRKYQHAPKHIPPVGIKGTWGAQTFDEIPALKSQLSEYMVDKHQHSAFISTDLDFVLRAQRIKTLLVTGVETNVCVESTARDGYMLGYHIVFLANLTATSTPDLYEPTLQNIQRYFGYVTTSDHLKTAWSTMNL